MIDPSAWKLAVKMTNDRETPRMNWRSTVTSCGNALLAVSLTVGLCRAGEPANPVYEEVVKGFEAGGVEVKLPPPSLSDDESKESETKALTAIAGSAGEIADFVRDSVAAPVVLKTPEPSAKGDNILRTANVWFVVRADPAAADLSKLLGDPAKEQQAEAANMKFRSVGVGELGLKESGVELPSHPDAEQYVHMSAQLLGRIGVDVTNRLTSSSTPASTIVAGRTDRRFDGSKAFPNHWFTIDDRKQAPKPVKQPFPGVASYAKATRLQTVPGALLVEVHFAYFEPKRWFDGNPVISSKFRVVAQDRVRELRRQLQIQKSRTGAKKP